MDFKYTQNMHCNDVAFNNGNNKNTGHSIN